MFINIYKKIAGLLAKIPLLAKILLGSIVIAAILSLSVYSLWLQFFADTIISWAPDSTVFYAHFSIPTYTKNDTYQKLVQTALNNSSLSSTTADMIKREIAFIVFEDNGQDKTLAIIRPDSPRDLEKNLKSNQLNFRRLSNDLYAIGEAGIINSLSRNNQNQLRLKTRKKLSPLSTLTIYGDKKFISRWLTGQQADYWQDIFITLLAGNNDAYFNLRTNRQSNLGLVGQLNGRQKINTALPSGYDLAFNFSKADAIFSALAGQSQLPPELAQDLSMAKYFYGLDSNDEKIKKIARNRISGIIKNKNTSSTGWFWADKDVAIKISAVADEADVQALEKIFKNILARQKPASKKIKLNDDSHITELVWNPEIINFDLYQGVWASNPELPVRLYYQTTTAGLIFTNNLNLISDTSTWPAADFISIGQPLMGKTGLWLYGQTFNYLDIFTNGKIILR